eukprot:COSAG04_NODE_434_length_14479_cov_52.278164_12_plen_146_part_00
MRRRMRSPRRWMRRADGGGSEAAPSSSEGQLAYGAGGGQCGAPERGKGRVWYEASRSLQHRPGSMLWHSETLNFNFCRRGRRGHLSHTTAVAPTTTPLLRNHPPKMPQKVLVTGASGLIGGLIVTKLEDKYEFSALNRSPLEDWK